MNGIVARGTDRAKVIQVIETVAMRGDGSLENMCRWVRQYWSLEGELLAENDPCEEDHTREAEDVKEMEAVVAVSDGTCGSVERYHTEKELREAVMPLLDERVISVDITKRAPERGPSRNFEMTGI